MKKHRTRSSIDSLPYVRSSVALLCTIVAVR